MLPRYRTGERRDSLHGLLLVLVVLQVQLHHDFLHPRTKNVRSSAQQRPDRQARKSKSREKQNESSLGSKARSDPNPVPLERRPALRTRTGTAGRKKPDRDQCEQRERGRGRGLPSTSRRRRTRTRGGSAADEEVRGWGCRGGNDGAERQRQEESLKSKHG